jgi:tRNA(fMet)-specific endonuclease VapC
MKLLFDTNILVHLAKDPSLKLLQQFNPHDAKLFVSIATVAELRSLALQNSWGLRRHEIINFSLEKMLMIEISENLVDTYAQIDAYSQCRNTSFTAFPHKTPRNMGKNDLWIASTAALLGLTLITRDSDFDHLNNVFFDVRKIKPIELKVR